MAHWTTIRRWAERIALLEDGNGLVLHAVVHVDWEVVMEGKWRTFRAYLGRHLPRFIARRELHFENHVFPVPHVHLLLSPKDPEAWTFLARLGATPLDNPQYNLPAPAIPPPKVRRPPYVLGARVQYNAPLPEKGWWSLAKYLLKPVPPQKNPVQKGLSGRLLQTCERGKTTS